MLLWTNSVVALLVNSRRWSSLRVVFSQTRNFTVIAFTGWIYCIEIFLPCPGKEFAVKLSTALNIFFTIQNFWAICACPETQSLPWKFSLYWIYFYIQDFWETCPCHEKQSVPWIHCIEYIFFIIQDFWATCACLEKQSCPEIFHCIEIFFIIQDFWATYTCPESRVCPEFTVLNVYFLSFRIFEQIALALKNTSCPDTLYWNIFIIQDFWATCACPENKVCPEFTVLNIYFLSFRIFALKFFRTGGAPPTRTLMDTGRGPFLAISRIFLNISLMLMSFNLLAFFFQPLLLSTFTLLLDILIYSFVLFLVWFELFSCVKGF